jgi:hypothetical protein
MSQPHLEPGRVYRTRDLAIWSANATRLATRLVEQGKLVPLAHGLFAHPSARCGKARRELRPRERRGVRDPARLAMTIGGRGSGG